MTPQCLLQYCTVLYSARVSLSGEGSRGALSWISIDKSWRELATGLRPSKVRLRPVQRTGKNKDRERAQIAGVPQMCATAVLLGT